MSSSRLRKCSQWCCRLTCLVVTLGICLSTVPLPLAQLAEKDLSQPFPCQHRACGCRSADQCWKTCCCFSNSQKVAWSKVHKIKLPGFVIAAAKAEGHNDSARKKSCCTQSAPAKIATPQTDVAVAPKGQVRYVMAALADQCQGNYWFWNSLPWAILPVVQSSRPFGHDIGEVLELTSERLLVSNMRPPIPPPRHV